MVGWLAFNGKVYGTSYALTRNSVIARHSSSARQPNFAALNRGHKLYSAGRPLRWALAHILVMISKKFSYLQYCICNTTRDVKRLSVYRLSFIFLVLVFEFQKPIIVSRLTLSSSRLKDASPRSAAIGRLVSLTHWHALAGEGECRRSTTANDR